MFDEKFANRCSGFILLPNPGERSEASLRSSLIRLWFFRELMKAMPLKKTNSGAIRRETLTG